MIRTSVTLIASHSHPSASCMLCKGGLIKPRDGSVGSKLTATCVAAAHGRGFRHAKGHGAVNGTIRTCAWYINTEGRRASRLRARIDSLFWSRLIPRLGYTASRLLMSWPAELSSKKLLACPVPVFISTQVACLYYSSGVLSGLRKETAFQLRFRVRHGALRVSSENTKPPPLYAGACLFLLVYIFSLCIEMVGRGLRLSSCCT